MQYGDQVHSRHKEALRQLQVAQHIWTRCKWDVLTNRQLDSLMNF